MRGLITTTINVPHNLAEWREQLADEDVIVVSGDVQTPHDAVRDFLATLRGVNVYIGIQEAEMARWRTAGIVGLRSIQRRNVALLELLRRVSPDKLRYVLTVDDDNYPHPEHVALLDRIFDGGEVADVTSSPLGWYDPCENLVPSVHHRGYPLSLRHVDTERSKVKMAVERIGVVASLWTGDPDVDALERICHAPLVSHLGSPSVVLDAGTWCPFNSQATAWLGDLAPIMMMWPGVGRYDDIWCSLTARRVMDELGWLTWYGDPLVEQRRNDHNLVNDLDNEMLGYRATPEVAEVLRLVDLSVSINRRPLSLLRTCYHALALLPWLPSQTLRSFGAWLDDLAMIGVR